MQISTPQKVLFLFGAGISIPANMPSTQKITQRALSGEDVICHSDGAYSFGKPSSTHIDSTKEWVPIVVEFLNTLKVKIDFYYSGQTNHFTNYDDLYYVVSQIHDSETGEYDLHCTMKICV